MNRTSIIAPATALVLALTFGSAQADEFVMTVREANGTSIGQLTVNAAEGESGSAPLFENKRDFAASCEIVGGKPISKQEELVTGMRFTARNVSAKSAQIRFVWNEFVSMTPISSGACIVHTVKTEEVASIETSVAIEPGARLVVLVDEAGRRYELARR